MVTFTCTMHAKVTISNFLTRITAGNFAFYGYVRRRDWVRAGRFGRSLTVTPAGHAESAARYGVTLD
jgi:hypothetical protein